MPELLDFDKDLIHLEAASKVFLLAYLCTSGWKMSFLLLKYVTEQLNLLFPQIQLKLLAEEMQAINKGLEKVEQELAASENDGAISIGFRKVRKS